jgi:mannose/cellobiose epimerase-like protein (N-acyl-D-glucosamine 2-epimerase family)
MSESDIFWTMATAAQYGGSFYQAMGNAGLAADPNNKRRILAAFPEMVATYGVASRLHQTIRAGVAA